MLNPLIERSPASFSSRPGQRPGTISSGQEAPDSDDREDILRRNDRTFRRFVAGSLLAATLIVLAMVLGWGM